METIIIGLGNPILSDDGVGWRIVERLRVDLPPTLQAGVTITEVCVGGLSLAEMLVGYQRAIIVDAIITGQQPPGTVRTFSLDELPGTLNLASAHDTNLVTALRALRRFEGDVPPDNAITIVAVEATDVWTFSEVCTPAVSACMPQAIAAILKILANSQIAC